MNKVSIFTLKALRKAYRNVFGGFSLPPLQREENIDKANTLIYNLLSSPKPCMVARFGAFELSTIVNYLGVTVKEHSTIKYIKGEEPEWWWNKSLMKFMQNNAGFFPSTTENLTRFSRLMLEDAKQVDILGSWQRSEYYIWDYMKPEIIKVDRDNMNPFFSNCPWTKILKGKNVLVIHPFSETIQKQYQRRNLLFTNNDILPDFNLYTIKAVQSLGGESNGFKDWFEALDWMKAEIDKIDYDVCLLGCGAYGFPLAAHVKRRGKKAVHIGGALQLYFGIKGKRWESEGYKNGPNDYSKIFNQYWVRPSSDETPSTANNVENNCYW